VAPAKAAPRSTMTNATVANVASSGSARRITVKYKGGEQTVVIGADVPVLMVEAGDPSLLVPGAHVVVTAARQLDGTLTTDRISVGTNGIVPPN
jgi:predicted regulator of Ras-like GTPase activity (Roadblock/LC7/MglB family)